MLGRAFWITGLPGSGKSTLALAAKEAFPEIVLLQMDEMRKIVTPEPTYSDEERELLYMALVYAAMVLTRAGKDVIIDATGHLRRWRDKARQLIPEFHEIYVKTPIETCIEREKGRRDGLAPVDIYDKAKKGWPVPGINVPYEEPEVPELVLDCEKMGAVEAAGVLLKYIKGATGTPRPV
jgi:adenylylsulfate kinase